MYRDITVLIVEDEPEFAGSVDKILTRKRFKTLRAPDVVTGLELMDKADVLLVDLSLPNGDGCVVLDHWNRREEGGPSVILSGYLPGGTEGEALYGAAWHVFKKPILMSTLVTVVERCAMAVRGSRCCKEVQLLKRRMVYMWIAIAALGGTQVFVPLIQSLIKSLGTGIP